MAPPQAPATNDTAVRGTPERQRPCAGSEGQEPFAEGWVPWLRGTGLPKGAVQPADLAPLRG